MNFVVAVLSLLLLVAPWSLSLSLPIILMTGGDGKKNTAAVGFDKWIEDAPEVVVTPKELLVEGEIPDYLQGTLIRNGGAIWTIDDKTRCGHIFDGLAKLSRYQIHSNAAVTFSSRFVDSRMYEEWVTRKSGTPTVLVGPRIDRQTGKPIPEPRWRRALWNLMWFDNTPVNIWDFHPPNTTTITSTSTTTSTTIECLTDTPIRATVDKTTLETLQKARQPPKASASPGFYQLTSTAHPEYCKKGTGATYNVGTMLAFPHYQMCLIRDDPDGRRQVVARIPLTPDNQIPYLHSFALTPTKAILLLQPLRQNPSIITVIQKGFLPSMIHVNETRVMVIDLESGEVVADTTLPEPVYFYHTISATEKTIQQQTTNNNNNNNHQVVTMKVCGYPVPDIITGPDAFLLFDRATTPQDRNRIYAPGGMLCDVTIHLDTNVATVQWTPLVDTVTQTRQGFELPTTRYSRVSNGHGPWQHGNHAQFAYAFGNYARGSSQYDSWALMKIDTATGDCVSLCQPDCFFSESVFVADPKGREEDDGVLLCTRFDGRTQQTSLVVVNAKTMTVMATANTGTRVAMDFHGAFFANQ
jgi:beta,beta-carotene 9',10'-dioxygenase